MPKGIYIRTEAIRKGLSGRKLTSEHKKKLSISHKGKRLSEVHKSKIGESHKGKVCSKETRKKIGISNTGKRRTKIALVNLSISHIGKCLGRKHWNWKNGATKKEKKIRNSLNYKLWREAVFARDNWTCQKYGIKGGKLHPHHIQNFAEYPELRFAIDNGITLSEKAHKEFHRIYGNRNNTKGQLIEFLNNN
jgi:hypothetical protein